MSLERTATGTTEAAVRRTVLERFPAGGPRGSWPAEEFAAARRGEGTPAEVVMDLEQDVFLVIVPQQPNDRTRRAG